MYIIRNSVYLLTNMQIKEAPVRALMEAQLQTIDPGILEKMGHFRVALKAIIDFGSVVAEVCLRDLFINGG
jgi:hypothetical protein